MIPKRPYYFRAMYDWILESNLTPHIVVDTSFPDVQVPPGFSEEGRITLNIAPMAVNGFAMNNECLEFKASFGGRLMHLFVPMEAIIAIYASENNHCLVFGPEEIEKGIIVNMMDAEGGEGGQTHHDPLDSSDDDQSPPPTRPKGPPKLSIVK